MPRSKRAPARPRGRRSRPTVASKIRRPRWPVQHGVTPYGYKTHVKGDNPHTLIRCSPVTAAAGAVWADAASRSDEIAPPPQAAHLVRAELGQRVSACPAHGSAASKHPGPGPHSCARRICLRPARHGEASSFGPLARSEPGRKNFTDNFQRFLVLHLPREGKPRPQGAQDDRQPAS